MNADTKPDEGNLDWKGRLGWVLAGAYGIGLLSRKYAESRLQYPMAASAGLLDPLYFIYGGVFIAFSIVSHLTLLAILVRKPWNEALSWLQATAARINKPLPTGFAKRFHLFFRWQSTVLTYIAPYFLVIWTLAGVATGWSRKAISLGLYFSAVPLVGWFRIYLERSGKVAEEKDLATPHLAGIFGLSKKHAQDFRLQYFVLFLAALAGILFFNDVMLSLGGGRPTRVLISLTSEANALKRSPLRSISKQPVWLLPGSDNFFVIRRSSDAAQPLIFVPRQFVSAVVSRPKNSHRKAMK
jgi:hypothetical protein